MNIFNYSNQEIIINMNKYCLNFEKTNDIITKYRHYYLQELEKIKPALFLRTTETNLSKIIKAKATQKHIVKTIINNVLNEFPILHKKKVYIFLFGSYACNLNRYDSDIDLSMIYNQNDYKILMAVEELIDYILSEIFGIYRDQIHTMMHYTVPDDVKCLSYVNDIKFTLKWQDGKFFSYKCRPNRESLLFKVHKCNRSLTNLKRYLSENINENSCKEWIIKFDTIFSTIHFDVNNHIHTLENRIKYNSEKIKIFLNEACEITQNLKMININKLYTVGDFKRYFKDNVTKLLNKVFNISRRINLKDYDNIELLDYSIYLHNLNNFNLFSESTINELKFALFSYMQDLTNIAYILNSKTIHFSHHNSMTFKDALFISDISLKEIDLLNNKRIILLDNILNMINILKGLINDEQYNNFYVTT